MPMKDRLEERWLEVQNTIKEHQHKIEEVQQAIQQRVDTLRSNWKQEVSKGVDFVFCVVMETLEKALSHLQKNTDELSEVKFLRDDEPLVTSSDWIQ